MTFKCILAAVDGSDGSNKALETAVDVQNAFDCELIILAVYRHHSQLEASLSMVRPDSAPELIDDTLRDHAKDVAESAKALAQRCGSTNVRAFVKLGQPARTIVQFGKEKNADLIVVGSRGHGDLEGFLLGSVSHKVTSLADCPVMVV